MKRRIVYPYDIYLVPRDVDPRGFVILREDGNSGPDRPIAHKPTARGSLAGREHSKGRRRIVGQGQ
jgi:hypothetical protein